MTDSGIDYVRLRHASIGVSAIRESRRRTLVPTAFPIASGKIKPLRERLAEAEAMRGEIGNEGVKEITMIIRQSARDFGELSAPTPPPPVCACCGEIMVPGYPKMREIQQLVASYYGVSITDIVSARKTEIIIHARRVGMYLCRMLTLCSFPRIGRAFGKDHSTVFSSVKNIETAIEMDKAVAAEIEALKAALL